MTGRLGNVSLAERVKALALATGFDLAGVASPEPGPDTAFFARWIEAGHAGEMDYLVRRADERMDPRKLMPEVRSIVVVGLSYARGSEAGEPTGSDPERGRVASYAGGEDYHDVMGDRLRALAQGMQALAGRDLVVRHYVDTGPVLERVFAARAGLGWIGKNTCLIHPGLGSRIFLGVVLSDLELAFDSPEPDHCGTCRACLDVCPTDAFPEPGVLAAERCLSYTTIELRDAIPEALRTDQGLHVFGCDLCQDVCPFARRAERNAPEPDPLGLRARLAPRPEWQQPPLAWLLGLDEDAFREAARATALRRAGRRGLQRNALIATGNAGARALRPWLERHARGDDALLAEHARWALAELERDGGECV